MKNEEEVAATGGSSPVARVMAVVVLILGLVLVAFGIWALGGAVLAAWSLFNEPDGIAYFAQYFLNSADLAKLLPGASPGLAHYVAWIAVILLLLVLGKLGLWAATAGAALIAAARR
jgi:hypothetical protein